MPVRPWSLKTAATIGAVAGFPILWAISTWLGHALPHEPVMLIAALFGGVLSGAAVLVAVCAIRNIVAGAT